MINTALATTIGCGSRLTVTVTYGDLINLLSNHLFELLSGLIMLGLSVHILYAFYKLLFTGTTEHATRDVIVLIIEYIALAWLVFLQVSIISIPYEACIKYFSDGTSALDFYREIRTQIFVFKNNSATLAYSTLTIVTALFLLIKGTRYLVTKWRERK